MCAIDTGAGARTSADYIGSFQQNLVNLHWNRLSREQLVQSGSGKFRIGGVTKRWVLTEPSSRSEGLLQSGNGALLKPTKPRSELLNLSLESRHYAERTCEAAESHLELCDLLI